MSYFCHINTHHIQPAVLPTTINNAINEHNDDSTRRTILFAHHAFRTACYYKWPNTPYNSTSFSRCPSLAWLPTYSTLAIKISVIEHINYTHPETAMITISHVWMDYSHLPQNCRGRAMTLVKREDGQGGGATAVVVVGSFIILRRTADAGYVDAWMLTALAFKQCAVIACKWTWICILTHLH